MRVIVATIDNTVHRIKVEDFGNFPIDTVTAAYVESISLLSDEDHRACEVRDEREKCNQLYGQSKKVKAPVELKRIEMAESEEEREVVEVEKGRVAAVPKSTIAGVQKAVPTPLKPGQA